MIGHTISHYHILEKLGEGGMGVVYKARDTRLNRLAVIKVLPPEKVSDADRKARFIQEARAASALNHPHIVTIYDILSYEGNECIVMEHIAGKTLAQAIEDKDLRLSDVLKYAAQMADALAAAHAVGIIHRDLKPSNIMLTETGLIKVLDFGLAKLAGDLPPPGGPTASLPRTDPGMVVGTVGYMAPEQVRGQPADRRSDIFNLGLILYEMLAGKKAFAGDSSIEVMSSILKESPPDLPESVPASLRQIVTICLEKNPSLRFESARDLGFALRALAAGTGVSSAVLKAEAAIGGRRWTTRLAAISLIILAALAAGLAILYLGRPEPLDLASYKFTPFATDPELEGDAVWSPDGRSIAYFKASGERGQVLVRSLDSPSPVQITRVPEGVDRLCFWSHDGNRIFFISQNSLWSVGSVGGEPHQELARVYQAALSPDGETLAFWRRGLSQEGAGASTLWISSPSGSSPRKYAPAPFADAGDGWEGNHLHFSPDGSLIGLSKHSDKGPDFWLLGWPDGPRAKPRLIFQDQTFSFPPTFDWMADSRRLILSIKGSLWMGDIKTNRLVRLTASAQGGERNPCVSPSGRQIAFERADFTGNVVNISLDGSRPRYVIQTAHDEFSPSWTSSGDLMAFVRSNEIWLRNGSGSWERPILGESEYAADESRVIREAVISPDGNAVAMGCRSDKSMSRIWLLPAAKGRPVLASPLTDDEEYGPTWSPDSASLAYLSWKGGSAQYLAVLSIGSQQPPQYISHEGFSTAPVWSPDGRWIACGSDKEQRILLLSPDGKTVRTLPSPVMPAKTGYFLVWARDSSRIYIASSLAEGGRLDVVDVRTEELKHIADFGPEIGSWAGYSHSYHGSLAPDGESFATSVSTIKSDLWILEGFPQPGRLFR
jgi:Tol biopolymer transport system component